MRNAGSTSEASQTVKEEDVVMDTNQAYETVEMHYRYQSAATSRSQPPVGLQEQSTSLRKSLTSAWYIIDAMTCDDSLYTFIYINI